uniref:Secreted protein n=1 Tax=Caenorhabditis japonica TaxID=281687 RepID=A0A8R1II49_CAEJA
MFFLLNPAFQFVLVVCSVCGVAICSCIAIERCLVWRYPVTDYDVGRVLYVPQNPPKIATSQVIIHITPPEEEKGKMRSVLMIEED